MHQWCAYGSASPCGCQDIVMTKIKNEKMKKFKKMAEFFHQKKNWPGLRRPLDRIGQGISSISQGQ